MTAGDDRLIMLSAGEASGGLHGATMCRALRALDPGVRLIGMGGPRMAAAGVEILVDPTADAAVGTSEAIGRVPALYRAYKILVRRLRNVRPQALVLIDFPEFNLRLAKQARRAGVLVIYFIPPQLWAWRRGRIRQMARRVTRVLAAFPFEQRLYEDAGVSVEFVGHPLLDVVPLDLDRLKARERLSVSDRQTMVGLLPGSRHDEVARLLPPMLEAVAFLARADGRRCFVLGLAPTVDRSAVAWLMTRAVEAGGPRVEIVQGLTHEGMARVLAKVQWISLPNIVAGRGAVPEILQRQVTGTRLASEAERLLEDPAAAAAPRAAVKEGRARLGQPGVGARAA